MKFKIVKYSPIFLSFLTKLLTQSFSIKNKDKTGLIQWKYFDSFFKNKSVTYIALDNHNNVVGHYSSMPITIQSGKTTYKATLSTDAATDVNHRGKGIMSELANKLYNDLRTQGYEFSFGFPNKTGVVMDKYSKNYGYKVVGIFAGYLKFVITRKKTPHTLTKINSPDSLKDIEYASENYCTIKKDKAYLTWRYLKKPNNEYEIYRIDHSKNIVGYAILRFTKRKAYIYDIVTNRNEISDMKSILHSIENKALDRNVRLVIYNVLDNEYWKKLFRFPYLKKVNNRNNYYFSVHIHDNRFNPSVTNKERWLLMSGDIL